jgi:hypothetical protein
MNVAFIRMRPGMYRVATRDNPYAAHIERVQTMWIAWDTQTREAIRGPFGLSGGPYRTLSAAKRGIQDHFATQ